MFQISRIIPLSRKSDAYEVERKYDFATDMLDLVIDCSDMLTDDTFASFLNWIDEALNDIWKHKEKLPDFKKDELDCLRKLVSAALNISFARDHKQHSRSPAIRAAEEARIRFWSKVAREAKIPSPRSQRIAGKLRSRYDW